MACGRRLQGNGWIFVGTFVPCHVSHAARIRAARREVFHDNGREKAKETVKPNLLVGTALK